MAYTLYTWHFNPNSKSIPDILKNLSSQAKLFPSWNRTATSLRLIKWKQKQNGSPSIRKAKLENAYL